MFWPKRKCCCGIGSKIVACGLHVAVAVAVTIAISMATMLLTAQMSDCQLCHDIRWLALSCDQYIPTHASHTLRHTHKQTVRQTSDRMQWMGITCNERVKRPVIWSPFMAKQSAHGPKLNGLFYCTEILVRVNTVISQSIKNNSSYCYLSLVNTLACRRNKFAYLKTE